MKYSLSFLILLASLLIFSACNDSTVSSSEVELTTEEFNLEAEKRAPSPGDQTIAGIAVESASAD